LIALIFGGVGLTESRHALSHDSRKAATLCPTTHGKPPRFVLVDKTLSNCFALKIIDLGPFRPDSRFPRRCFCREYL
jgi:hypothetical protein